MASDRPFAARLATLVAVVLLQGCSGEGRGGEADSKATKQAEVAAPGGADGPTASLAFEWSANGFEQLPAQYAWTGSGARADGLEPVLLLSVPETDDVIWSSQCAAGGEVLSRLYIAPPRTMAADRATLAFETDASGETRRLPARYVTGGQSDGFELALKAGDPIFADMKAGRWAYVQVGDGADATKLRISLAGAERALAAFLPACQAPEATSSPPATPVVHYACENGGAAEATYLGNDTDTPVVRLKINGRIHLLQRSVSASGARYEGDGAPPITWSTKGALGVFTEGDAGAETSVSCQEP